MLVEKLNEALGGQQSGTENGAAGGAGAAGDALSQFGRDLTAAAKEGKLDPVIGRSKEIQRVIQILSRRTKNNPALIGDPGVGKTAIVEGLAQKIVAGDVPENLKGKRVVALDLTGMIAGTKYRGEFEERIKKVIEELTQNKDTILFIDEMHMLMGAGAAEGAADAANILKPACPAAKCRSLVLPRLTNTARTSKRTRHSNAVSSRCRSTSRRLRTLCRS